MNRRVEASVEYEKSGKDGKFMGKRRIIGCLLIGVFLSITACSFFPTKINTILSDPRGYANKQVTVSGTVEDTFSLIVIKYYVLKDDTGEIPIISKQPMPAKGAQIKVKGTVQEAFSLGDQSLIVILEE